MWTNLSVVSDVVSKTNKTSLEFLWLKTSVTTLVEVVEGCTELVHLFFTDALRVTCQDLKMEFILSNKMLLLNALSIK